MRIDDARAQLHAMLREADVDLQRPTLRNTWVVFRAFAAEPVETASDGILVQGGVYAFYGPERYIFDFVRQFEVVYDDGEHDHYEQLHCEFQFEATSELRALGSFNCWWFADEGTPLGDFLDDTQGRAEFIAVEGRVPIEARIEQEQV